MRLSLTIDSFRYQLLVLLHPCPVADHQTMPQGIRASKVGVSYLAPGLTPLFILSTTHIGSSVIPGLQYMKWPFPHLNIHLSILHLSIYPFINPPIYTTIHSSICPPIHSSIHSSTLNYLFNHPPVYPTTSYPSPHLTIQCNNPYVEQQEHRQNIHIF